MSDSGNDQNLMNNSREINKENKNLNSNKNNLKDKIDNLDDNGLINRIQGSMMYKTNNLYNMINNLNDKIFHLGMSNSKDFDVYDQYKNGKN